MYNLIDGIKKSNEIFDKVIKVSIDNSNNKEINNNYNINKKHIKHA